MTDDEELIEKALTPARRYTRDTPGGLEQARRNFMSDHRDLYDYIYYLACSRVLDSAGDNFSSKHEVANFLWGKSADYKQKAAMYHPHITQPPEE